MNPFNFTKESRKATLEEVNQKLEHYYANTKSYPVANDWNIEEIRSYARQIDLSQGNDSSEVLNQVIQGLSQFGIIIFISQPFLLKKINLLLDYCPYSSDFAGVEDELVFNIINGELPKRRRGRNG